MNQFLARLKKGSLNFHDKLVAVMTAAILSIIPMPMLAFAAATNGLNTGITFIDSMGNAALAIIQFVFWLIIAWVSMKLLRDKAYGQFWGFLLFALIVYMLIFQRSFLDTISTQILALFKGGGGGASTGGGTGGGAAN